MDAPWITLLALFVLLASLFYLLVERKSERSDQQLRPRKWHVQCPKCLRWKKMMPVNDNANQIEEPAIPQINGRYQFQNSYKCPFCGHHWEETYLE